VDLAKFLADRLAEDEGGARLAAREGGTWTEADPVRQTGRIESLGGVVVYDEGAPDENQAAHIARHDPARVLREVEAKRKILTDLDLSYPDEEHLLRLLAAIYEGHPDFDPAWKD
jgi:hypothetical protein